MYQAWEGEYYLKIILTAHRSWGTNALYRKGYEIFKLDPKMGFAKSIEVTINWYKDVYEGNKSAIECSLNNLKEYVNE